MAPNFSVPYFSRLHRGEMRKKNRQRNKETCPTSDISYEGRTCSTARFLD